LTVPDAPANLVNNAALTNATQIGLIWNEGFSNGGSVVLSYHLYSD
jgi:hypothetical protein